MLQTLPSMEAHHEVIVREELRLAAKNIEPHDTVVLPHAEDAAAAPAPAAHGAALQATFDLPVKEQVVRDRVLEGPSREGALGGNEADPFDGNTPEGLVVVA